jgi:hypothetical protein
MEARPHPRNATPRFWVALQPSIVRIYKVAGLICLTAILVGLIGFLTVNIFYFFDKSWVRPIRLAPGDAKVVEASNSLADAKLRASNLGIERVEIDTQLKEIDEIVKSDETFIAQASAQVEVANLKTPEAWLLRREVDKANLDKINAIGRRIPLNKRMESLKARIDEQDKIVARLAQSPYLKAADHPVVLAFVPYKNLDDTVKVGTKLYRCSWGLVACSNVGKVTAILPGEVSDKHPHDDSVQRGQFVEVDVSESAGGSTVLFGGSKPLWLF